MGAKRSNDVQTRFTCSVPQASATNGAADRHAKGALGRVQQLPTTAGCNQFALSVQKLQTELQFDDGQLVQMARQAGGSSQLLALTELFGQRLHASGLRQRLAGR